MGKLTYGNGLLLDNGAPFQAIGFNAYSMLEKNWGATDFDRYKTDIPLLASLGVRFIRVMITPYSGAQLASFVGAAAPAQWSDLSAGYRTLVTDFFDRCAANNISVVASLFWNKAAVPDMNGETFAQAAAPTSASYQYWMKFIDVFVQQFTLHPAVAAWQVGNEWELAKTQTELQDVSGVVRALAARIRQNDPDRLILSGASANPYQTTGSRSSPAKVAQCIIAATPAECVAETHLYPNTNCVGTAGQGGAQYETPVYTYDFVKYMMAKTGGALVLGEFGVNDAQEPPGETSKIATMIDGITRAGCQLAFAWNWNESVVTSQQTWNIYPGTARGDAYVSALSSRFYMLGAPKRPSSAGIYDTTSPAQPLAAYVGTGATSSITVPANAVFDSASFTIAFWVRRKYSRGNYARVITHTDSGNTRGWHILNTPTGELYLEVRGSPGRNSAGTFPMFPLNTWHWLAFTTDGATYIKSYLDGREMNVTAATMTPAISPGADPIVFGQTSFATGHPVDLADVVIFNQALSHYELADFYRTGTPPSGCVGRWKLNGDAFDSVGENHGSAGAGVSYSGVDPRKLRPRSTVRLRKV